jgi:formate dehydrogenase subunit gamma
LTGKYEKKGKPMSGDRLEETVRAIIDAHRGMAGAALPILAAIQEAVGYVPDAVLPMVAEALNISRAEIYGIVTFYHDFRREPPGRHVVKLCRAEACQSVGGREIAAHICKRLGLGFGETSADGRVTLEAVYCLGLCAVAPSAMVDGTLVGRLDSERADQLVAEVNR